MSAFFHKHKDLLLLFILSLVPLLWYGLEPNMMIASNDTGSSTNPVMLALARFFTWNSAVNFGVSQTNFSGSMIYYGIEALSTYVTNSIFTGQKIVVLLWFSVPMFVMYICLKKIPVFEKKPYMPLLAAILFQFNHYQQHGWRVFWRTRFSTYIMLPLLLMFLIDYLEGKRTLVRTAIFVGLSVFLLNGGGSPPVFGAPILLVIVTVCFFLLTHLRDNVWLYVKRSVLFIVACSFSSFLLSTVWVIPFFYQSLGLYADTIEKIGGLASTLPWTDVVSYNTSALMLLRNVGLPFWNTTYTDPHLFLTNPLLIIISIMWPALAFSSLIFAKKYEEKKYVTLFLLFVVVGLVFTAGTHKPFREFYIFLLNHIPGYVMFRSPLYKFGNLLWYAFPVLMAFSISSIIELIRSNITLKKHIAKRISALLPVFFIAFILLWDYPIFNSTFFAWKPPLTTMLKIPPYVMEFSTWMNNQSFVGRTLLLPEFNREFPIEVYRWGYWSHGSQLIGISTSKSTITNDSVLVDFEQSVTNVVVNKIYDYLKENDPNWLMLAEQFNIRYLLIRNDLYYDIPWHLTTNPAYYESILAGNKNIKKIKTFGQWDLYEIQTQIPSEKIYVETKPIYFSKKDGDMLHLFPLIKKKYPDVYQNLFFVSINDIPESLDITQNANVVVPGPMDIVLPVERGKLTLPAPQRLPNSLLYFLTQGKEENLIKKTTKADDLVKLHTRLSLLRLAELDGLITSKSSIDVLKPAAARYESAIVGIRKNIDTLLSEKKDSSRLVVATRGFLKEEEDLLKTWIKNQYNPSIKGMLEEADGLLLGVIQEVHVSEQQEAVLSGIAKPYYNPDVVFLSSDYTWKVPVSGIYDVYMVKSSNIFNNDGFTVHIDDYRLDVTKEKNDIDTQWQNIGAIQLESGEHSMSIEVDGKKLASFRKNDIVFLKQSDVKRSTNPPEVAYRKINPTKYAAIIIANEPFLFVFDEKYDPDWKLYMREKPLQHNGIIGAIQKAADDHILNTLPLTPLPEGRHVKVNSSVNGWYIDPPAKYKNKEFEVIAEYSHQRVFYVSLITNVVALFACLTYIILFRHRKRA